MKKIIASTPAAQKIEKVCINSAQKEKALNRLKIFDDGYFFDTFKELLEDPHTKYDGFPAPLNQTLAILHGMKWMNPMLTQNESALIDTGIELQLKKTIIPTLNRQFHSPNAWSLDAVQMLCPRISPVAFKLEEHPYVRLYIERGKIHWRIQQYKTVLFPGSSHENFSSYYEKTTRMIDLSIQTFLMFKQAGKRTPSNKTMLINNTDTRQPESYSRERPNRAIRTQNKGLENSTRLFDVDEYGELTAHRPDGILRNYELDACFIKAKNDRTSFTDKHHDAVQSLSKYVQSCLEKGVLNSDKKVIFQFPDASHLGQWLFPQLSQAEQCVSATSTKGVSKPYWILGTLWGPQKIMALKEVFKDLVQGTAKFLNYTTLINQLFMTLVQIKQNYETGKGDLVRYDHIPQKAAIKSFERSHRVYRNDTLIDNSSFAIALPKWLDNNGETNSKKPDLSLPLASQLIRDIQAEWKFWIQAGHYEQQKTGLGNSDFEALGAYRYLAKCFIKRHSAPGSLLRLEPNELNTIDDFFTQSLQKLSIQGNP